ncbi:hypothetical protein HHK36_009031 [Tetracentron sinense]|uniref:non-specific serine/threonine protein kinase n=1 Tax=Tetracentron sinense TaxID=13715 RepID=A0A834ZI08_TETSI|nr:hypothetical protein HHK36_009031 [Tetracentron sinense]
MGLTPRGITIVDQDGNLQWSTPMLKSPVMALQLSEAGNLLLLDRFNASLWESFDYPTDTIVIGQRLPVGKFLSSPVSDVDLSTGDYQFTVTSRDAVLQWKGLRYWMLSMDTRAYVNSNSQVGYLAMNATGLYLFGGGGSVVVIQVILSRSDARIARLDSLGRFIVSNGSGTQWEQEFARPVDDCQIPFICGRIGLCTDIPGSKVCSCPPSFQGNRQKNIDCLPTDSSYSLPSACNSTSNGSRLNSSEVSYLRLEPGMDYFSNGFSTPVEYGVNLSTCQDLCTLECSCLGVFYQNSSGSCYLLKDQLGSIIMSTEDENDRLGYIKAVGGFSPKNTDDDDRTRNFPIIVVVLLPSSGFFLLIMLAVLVFVWWRRRPSSTVGVKLGRPNSSSSTEFDPISIPGLPVRFEYEELEVATDNFNTQIGAGGFGAVFKGTLSDQTLVAVKKINDLGLQGKKEFCTEIATIGNIHHVNLVKLRGFCAQGRQRLLVYEFMNRGSLDRTLFGNAPVLEWQERTQSQSNIEDESNGGGRTPSSSGPGPAYFPLFALEMHEQGRYLGLEDPRLEGRATSEDVEKLVRVALCCVHEEPYLRPSMANVVAMLEGGIALGKPRVESLNFLRFYGRRFTEASMIEEHNGGSEFMLYPQANASATTTTTSGSRASLSYISSQQVSGPR